MLSYHAQHDDWLCHKANCEAGLFIDMNVVVMTLIGIGRPGERKQ